MGNVERMQNFYAALGGGDVGTVLGGMDSDIEWREAESNPYQPSGEPWIGPEAIVNNLLAKLATEWDGFTVNPKDFHDAGDVVVVEARYSGTYKATNKALDAQVTHIWRLRDGKVTSFQQYVDTAQLQDVMGAR
ncbi:MAG: nuclear transport factor 2 family protein [Acidimicrobiales bacterium]